MRRRVGHDQRGLHIGEGRLTEPAKCQQHAGQHEGRGQRHQPDAQRVKQRPADHQNAAFHPRFPAGQQDPAGEGTEGVRSRQNPHQHGRNVKDLPPDRRDQRGIGKGQQVHRDRHRQHARDRDVAAGEGDPLGQIARHLADDERPAALAVFDARHQTRPQRVNAGGDAETSGDPEILIENPRRNRSHQAGGRIRHRIQRQGAGDQWPIDTFPHHPPARGHFRGPDRAGHEG